MKIVDSVLSSIFLLQNETPPESGGILGGKGDSITHFCPDRGRITPRMCGYSPDTTFLNEVIANWQQQGIRFMGIYHSHFFGVSSLSHADIQYIHTIMNCMPPSVDELYFPVVVMPDRKMVCYKAKKQEEQTAIQNDALSIIKNAGGSDNGS